MKMNKNVLCKAIASALLITSATCSIAANAAATDAAPQPSAKTTSQNYIANGTLTVNPGTNIAYGTNGSVSWTYNTTQAGVTCNLYGVPGAASATAPKEMPQESFGPLTFPGPNPGGSTVYKHNGSQSFTGFNSFNATMECSDGYYITKLVTVGAPPYPAPSINISYPTAVIVDTYHRFEVTTQDASSCNMNLAEDNGGSYFPIGTHYLRDNFAFSVTGTNKVQVVCTGPTGLQSSEYRYIHILPTTDPEITSFYADNHSISHADLNWVTLNTNYCEMEGKRPGKPDETVQVGTAALDYKVDKPGTYRLTCNHNASNRTISSVIEFEAAFTSEQTSMKQDNDAALQSEKAEFANKHNASLVELGINLNAKGLDYSYSDIDLDGDADLLIHVPKYELFYVLLNQDGQFTELSKIVYNVKYATEIGAITVEDGKVINVGMAKK